MKDNIIKPIFKELRKAEEKFPGFPNDLVYCACILGEETGEVIKEALDFEFGRVKSLDGLKKELSQTSAMCIRFLLKLEEIEKNDSKSSRQSTKKEVKI